jgi:hypothetical protein
MFIVLQGQVQLICFVRYCIMNLSRGALGSLVLFMSYLGFDGPIYQTEGSTDKYNDRVFTREEGNIA